MIEAFNEKIPRNPAKAGGQNYEQQKRKQAEELFEEEKRKKQEAAAKAFEPFDKPLTQEQKYVETKEERNERLLRSVDEIIRELQAKIDEGSTESTQDDEEQIIQMKLLKQKILDHKNNT